MPSSYHERIYAFLRKHVLDGRQAYIVCSMVSENEELSDERKAVTEYTKTLQETVFPDLRVGCVHGRMKPKEKEAVMSAFAGGETDILVSTTVIEVGVDVPNAAVMVVENAERFGLSQLHQLRGRVGRGQHQSYCILISDNKNEETKQRLKVMTQTSDGFRIAEEDLRLRCPGDFFGERQHGLPGLRVADIGCDTQLLQEAKEAAEALLANDPQLQICCVLPLLVPPIISVLSALHKHILHIPCRKVRRLCRQYLGQTEGLSIPQSASLPAPFTQGGLYFISRSTAAR